MFRKFLILGILTFGLAAQSNAADSGEDKSRASPPQALQASPTKHPVAEDNVVQAALKQHGKLYTDRLDSSLASRACNIFQVGTTYAQDGTLELSQEFAVVNLKPWDGACYDLDAINVTVMDEDKVVGFSLYEQIIAPWKFYIPRWLSIGASGKTVKISLDTLVVEATFSQTYIDENKSKGDYDNRPLQFDIRELGYLPEHFKFTVQMWLRAPFGVRGIVLPVP